MAAEDSSDGGRHYGPLLEPGGVDDVSGAAAALAAAQEAWTPLKGDAGTDPKVGNMTHTSMRSYPRQEALS